MAERCGPAVIAGGALLSLVPVALTRSTDALAVSAHACGMLAGYAAAVMLVLTSRAPVLERRVGAGTLLRWHARGGLAVIVLISAHTATATVAWFATGHSWTGLLSIFGLLLAVVGTGLLLLLCIASTGPIRRRLTYEQWHGLHVLSYVAIGLGFIHQLAGPDLAGNRIAQIGWSLLYTYAFALTLRYRLVEPLRQAHRHRLRVASIRHESPDTFSLLITGRHLRELAAEAGQFFRWRFLTPHTWHSAHPFSLSAAPREDGVRITIKILGEGTRRLQSVAPGTRVIAEGPYGRIARPTRPVLLIAGGIGITPLRALFETLNLPGEQLTLIYRATRSQDILFRDELDTLARKRRARVIYLVGPSSDPANAITRTSLTRLLPDLHLHEVYLCAAPRFRLAVREALRAAGLPRAQVHDEALSF